MSTRRTVQDETEAREARETSADAPLPRRDAATVLALQRTAGNAAVSRLMAGGERAGGPRLQRWVNLGTESWRIPPWGPHDMTVWTGTKQEWLSRLDNIDDEDEYKEDLWGFLKASNDPGIVGRTRPPDSLNANPASIGYRNTIRRAPSDAEKLAFLEALFEKSGGLDLWHGSVWEGGPWIRLADKELAQFLRAHQSLYLVAVSRAGKAVTQSGVSAVATQGGRAATMAMIVNGGATAHKGVDLVRAANQLSGREREVEHSRAMELIRNSGRTIRGALQAHNDRVTFEKELAKLAFDTVWGTIPGGNTIVEAGKGILKFGLEKGLESAMKDDGPSEQAESINNEFVEACNRLVAEGHIDSADAQDAINGFEAVRR